MTLVIEVVRHEALTAEQMTAIIALTSLAFEGDMAEFIEAHTNGAHILGTLDGVLVSHASWVSRQLQPEGLSILQTAYVEDVATHPSHERQGFASAVMRRMADEIKDFELGGLATATGRSHFYAGLGWELWRGKTFARTEQGLLDTPDEGLMILRLARTPPLNLDAPISCEWRPGEIW